MDRPKKLETLSAIGNADSGKVPVENESTRLELAHFGFPSDWMVWKVGGSTFGQGSFHHGQRLFGSGQTFFPLPELLGFASGADHYLEETAQSVADSLYGNPNYSTEPPVSELELRAALAAFMAAFMAAVAAFMAAVAESGGPEQTADKANKREALIVLLRRLAAYVQENHGNDLAKLLSSGFEAASTNRAQASLDRPAIREIKLGHSGEAIPKLVATIRNARGYQVRVCPIEPNGAPGAPLPVEIYTNSRSMRYTGLTPGALYQFEIRAVGGSDGYSDWSDPVISRVLGPVAWPAHLDASPGCCRRFWRGGGIR